MLCASALEADETGAPDPAGRRVQHLSGTGLGDTVDWEFRIDRGRGAGSWTLIPVPSQWELEGFGEYAYGMDDPNRDAHAEVGWYRHDFEVPPDWRPLRVWLVFEGVMTDARVSVNGREAGAVHRGGFTEFRYDVTDLLTWDGSNRLEVEVSEASADSSVERAEREADYWVFGGIYRPVYLEALPPRSIRHLAIDARHDGDLRVEIELEGVRGSEALEVRVRELATGRLVGEPLLRPLEGERRRLSWRAAYSGVEPWSAERPHRYRLEVGLVEGGEALHARSATFGFRTVELRAGEGLFVNGRRILLRGVNRHSIWPESGRTLNRELNRRDAELVKELNANAVRSSHYPPDRDFLDACDELGIYVIDELPGWHDAYRAGVGRRLVAEMVRRDVNHPSVILWANGNEGGWNSLLDGDFARHDPQGRPVIHPGSVAGGVDATHYPTFEQLTALLTGDSIARWVTRLGGAPPLVLPTEMLHGLYDGGGGSGLAAFWKAISASPRGLGGFLWSLIDEGVVRTDRGGILDTRANYAPDGIVGAFREKEASFDTARALWSPVELLEADWKRGAVTLANRYSETSLDELRFIWRGLALPGPDDPVGPKVVFEVESSGPSVAPGEVGELSAAPLPDIAFDALEVSAFDRFGRSVATWSGWAALSSTQLSHWLPAADESGSSDVERPEWLTSLRAVGEGEIDATWFAVGDEWLRAEIRLDGVEGASLDLAGLEPVSVEWLGEGPWPVWGNRLAGTTIGTWRRDLDDPGAPWRSARGFYRGVRWLELAGAGGVLTAAVETPGFYVGVSTPDFPEDARNARAEVPSVGELSLLRVVPSIGTKFHPAGELGPVPEATAGPERLVVWLRFRPSE